MGQEPHGRVVSCVLQHSPPCVSPDFCPPSASGVMEPSDPGQQEAEQRASELRI